MAVSAKEKFLTLLYGEILKLDLAELDFGLYRILKYRRDEIRAFFDRKLPVLMAEAVGTMRQDRFAEVERRLVAQREKLDKSAQALGLIGAFAEDGTFLQALAAMPVAEEYQRLSEEHRRLAVDAGFTQSEEERLYNHLYLFFSRYYQDGDFIPQPRRGRGDHYSVAYCGEDIHFHWRGRGSHYVKTTETLRSYGYQDSDWRVEFVLRKATEEQDNAKGRVRYFFPDNEELDYYLKHEFLDVEGFVSPEAMTDKFIKFRALRGIGREIIKFLDQVETFQARLFEKRKFVLRANYLAPVRLVDRILRSEILKFHGRVTARRVRLTRPTWTAWPLEFRD